MKQDYKVVIEQDEQGVIAYTPDIPGANGQGETEEEAVENLQEAVALILLDRREDDSRSPSEKREAAFDALESLMGTNMFSEDFDAQLAEIRRDDPNRLK